MLLLSPKVNVFLSLYAKRSLGDMLSKFLRSVKLYFGAHFVSVEWWVGVFDKHVVNGGGELSSFWGWNVTI